MNLEEKVSKYMRKDLVYVRPESTLGDVASVMSRSGTDVAVVRSKGNEVLGLITASELFDAMRSYVLGKDILENIPVNLRDIRVQELMRNRRATEFMEVCGLSGIRVCLSISDDDTIANAIRVLAMSGISHLLVIGEKGVVGTLCAEDLVKAFAD